MEKNKAVQPRIAYGKVSPEGVAILGTLENYLKGCGLDPGLLELVKLRSSQINGCAFCIDMHTKDARSRGESEQRLYALSAWRETPFYTARERAALEWTEAVTKVSDHQVPDEIYELVKPHFTEKELVDLTLAVIAINAWNRLAISFRTPAGSYKPSHPVTRVG
ncbi:carboxymuconolactone decarboxylase family protein [Sphaerochaeta sp. PS]|uniref:carboxymuconolactone decarboxylase family protein n=1 Tax=Sphaerochaeta sp. PS TaxID=3076336 RepID=UPI0028A4EFF0|nr:carboxymuconolactone decarboxylase family protein [Sphaerochaeta sp. PS]MDT4761784.1 carboxymuconolactone decarboxylase family protein [Sphaerochaeta sp. PS]